MVEFQEVFDVSMGRSSIIPFCHSLGTITANIFAALLLSRIGTTRSSRYAVIAGIVGLTFATLGHSLFLLAAGIFFIALAFGLTITTYSVVYSHFPPTRQNFSLFHSFFGLGGLTAPIFVKFFLGNAMSYQHIYAAYLVLLICFAIYLFFRPIADFRADGSAFQGIRKLMAPRYIVLITLLALYSVSEMAIVVWAGNFFNRRFLFSVQTSALMLSGFWILFTTSRLLGDFQIRRLSPKRNAHMMSLTSFIVFAVFIFAPVNFSVLAFLVGALSMATIFPSIHLFLNRNTPSELRSPLNSLLFLMVSTLGMAGVPLLGIVGDFNIYLGMSLMLIPFALMVFFLPLLFQTSDSESCS